LVALALADARDVNLIARRENVGFDLVARAVRMSVKPEFLNMLARLDVQL
jgi:hypothetical protein